MKKQLLLFCILNAGMFSFAQISIDATDFPAADDTALVSVSDDFNAIDLTDTGADFEWNYSDLHILNQRIDTFFNVGDASALYQLQYNNAFTEPEYVSDYYYDLIGFDLAGAEDAGISINKPVGFVRITGSEVQNVGLGLELNGYEIPMAADTIDTEYEIPFTYGDSWTSDSYIYVDLNPAFNGIFQRYQYRTSEVDGWGTLTTRFGTFEVVRVRTEIAYDDSAYVDFGFGGTWVELPTPDEVIYTWWSEGNKIPVLKVVAQLVGSNENITRIEFKDQERNLAGISEEENFAAQIYPNPANETVNLILDESVNQVTIYSISGTVVYQTLVSNTQQLVDVSEWSAGIYTVQLLTSNGVQTSKLVVE